MSDLEQKVRQRRTFAIISHPDAGKTTLTEKLLLLGGAVQQAGAVKAKGQARRAHSDWMKVERERGISVSSSVMTFQKDGVTFNLLDTPGHSDFSEDTYRTLTAVDSVIMVLDAAKGIEAQTKKLFEVCRLRDMPIITFINKLDREAQDPFALLEEIEETLAITVSPATWPVGMGKTFVGAYDLQGDRMALLKHDKSGKRPKEGISVEGIDDSRLGEFVPSIQLAELREQAPLARELCPAFDRVAYLEGHQTPVYFGSALNSFGVTELLSALACEAPPPRPQPAQGRDVDPCEEKVTGFVFKVQANMDPKHRDRIAYVRLCSGEFKRGMRLKHVRTGKFLSLTAPLQFFAQEREIAERAYPGDILGLVNHGNLRIGDALSEGEDLSFSGIPAFAPELLRAARSEDPLKTKHLSRALEQLAEEGAARVFRRQVGADWIVGVVGPLQFEVLRDRIRNEYGLPVRFENSNLFTARWVESADNDSGLVKLKKNQPEDLGEDHDGDLVFLARNTWHLERAEEEFSELKFNRIKEVAC